MVAAQSKLGDHMACATCGSDIEYQGGGRWVDRGGGTSHHWDGRRDQDGIPLPTPRGRHHPGQAEIERHRAYDRAQRAEERDRAAYERWKKKGRPRTRLLGRTGSRTARRHGAR